jgi:hypothetical protein
VTRRDKYVDDYFGKEHADSSLEVLAMTFSAPGRPKIGGIKVLGEPH